MNRHKKKKKERAYGLEWESEVIRGVQLPAKFNTSPSAGRAGMCDGSTSLLRQHLHGPCYPMHKQHCCMYGGRVTWSSGRNTWIFSSTKRSGKAKAEEHYKQNITGLLRRMKQSEELPPVLAGVLSYVSASIWLNPYLLQFLLSVFLPAQFVLGALTQFSEPVCLLLGDADLILQFLLQVHLFHLHRAMLLLSLLQSATHRDREPSAVRVGLSVQS